MASILCVYDSSFAPFGRYVLEMLQTEGLTQAVEHNVAVAPLSAERLRDFDLVILAPTAPASGAETVVLQALKRGTPVVFMRPSPDTAQKLGLASAGRSIADGYILPDYTHELCFAELGERLQFHGRADCYQRAANVVAWIQESHGTSLHPAVVTGTHGAGAFAFFAYDLAKSTVLFHQGRRELANTDTDGDGFFAPNDLFKDHLDFSLRHVPQADLQQRLLVRLLESFCENKAPLCRIWNFPGAHPAIALINGDSDSMTRAQLEWYVNMTEAHGGHYTLYIMESDRPLFTPALAADYRRRGHSVGPHYWLKEKPTVAEFSAHIQSHTEKFTEYYSHPARTTRHHCVVWPGWVDTAQALADAGIRMETNYRAAEHNQSGYLTGSGLPMRFIGEHGEFIECFQQETLLCDDYALVDKSHLPPLSIEQVVALSIQLLDDSVKRYHTAVQIYFHPVYATGMTVYTGQFIATASWLEAVLKYCMANNIPMLNVDEWCEFNELRRITAIHAQSWDPQTGRLVCRIRSVKGLPGGTVLIPQRVGGYALQRAQFGEQQVLRRPQIVHGREYWLMCVNIPPGDSELVVEYTPAVNAGLWPVPIKSHISMR